MMIFPRSPIWDVIRGLTETLNVLDCISETIANKNLKFGLELHRISAQMGFNFRV